MKWLSNKKYARILHWKINVFEGMWLLYPKPSKLWNLLPQDVVNKSKMHSEPGKIFFTVIQSKTTGGTE